jgi:hypothetical protein
MTIKWMIEESEAAVETMTAAQVSAWKVASCATTLQNEELADQARSAATAADNAAALMRELNLKARSQEPRP